MLTLNDGRSELWQWDTGRTLAVDADCSQVHFSNKVFGRSIDVDVVDGVATIPDILLQTDKELNVWAFVGTAENGYTKISKTFKLNRRNKPADYVFTPTDQMTLHTIQSQIGDLADLTTESKENLVAAINEAARTGGGAGSMELRVADGYVQYSRDGGSTWENLIAMADLKGDPGTAGKDGHSPVVTATKSGKTTTISVDGAAIATVEDGADGAPGSRGADGITPTIGANGNWYLGETDTGKPSRGEDGATGATGEKGNDGKSAYAYAVDGGYTGTEAEFAAKLASGALIVTLTDSTDSSSDWLADKSYNDIRDAILSGIPVYVFNGEQYLSLAVVTDASLFFGTAMGVNDGTGIGVFTILIEITNDDKVKNAGNYVEIPTNLPNPNALTFTGAVTGSYDGSAPLSVEIPSGGGSGSDISLGLTGAAAGQIAKITAVDGTGKPTAWEAVDMPSGGGGQAIDKIAIKITETVHSISLLDDITLYNRIRANIKVVGDSANAASGVLGAITPAGLLINYVLNATKTATGHLFFDLRLSEQGAESYVTPNFSSHAYIVAALGHLYGMLRTRWTGALSLVPNATDWNFGAGTEIYLEAYRA